MVDEKTIENIAKLARLEISKTETEEFSRQFTKILDYFDQLSALNTSGVEPLITPADIDVFWREDEVKQDCSAEEMVKNAPDKVGNLFRVPPVI